ncbi:MAG TPA: glycoside hydrolase family 2 TIM barrel-domain containing protein [Candidatus Hydrogenedentes bacterium]|nr:glycoside hydrolase family 2 TIM barrel-domain containing protein [Candidatus Hydrogenedentota bacterium]
MKRQNMHWAIVAILCCTAMLGFSEGRPTISLDGAWSFRMDPEKAGESEQWFSPTVTFVDTIQVPGAWEAQGFGEATDKLHHHFIGKGWYKRQADIPAEWAGKRVFLCFGGVHRYGAVWVNGKSFGEHIGYMSPFEFDITDCATPGTQALIAVRIDSEQRWDVDTLLGCFDIIDYMDTYWGGIWGHVHIEARNNAYLEDLFVEPAIAPPHCRVSATVKGNPPEGASLHLDILDKRGDIVWQTDGTLASKEKRVSVQIDAPAAQLWTPDTPNLYIARLALMKGGEIIDRCETRFGFRQITIEGSRILLNGQPFFLRGYGDDAIYPETMAPPSDEAVYRKKVAIAKEYGFNHVRHHSHMLPPEYYDVCDELGMLVSAEFPIGYEPFYKKAKGPALDLYTSEWTAAILRLRNHPSIFDWCMGNEMYKGVAISPDLYRIAKELDPTRPVVDSDGLPQTGFVDGTKDRDTLDLYFTQFDVFNNPLDKPQLYECPSPKKPVVSHETGNYVTFPRLDQIDLFKDNFIPFWLISARDKVQKMGLLNESTRWAENTERLYTLLRKIDIETLRKSPKISGYHWWLLQDYWTTSNGIIDTYFRPKPGISRDAIVQFNNAVVLLQDALKNVYRGGDPLQIALFVSNFGPVNLVQPKLSYKVMQGTDTLMEQTHSVVSVEQGIVAELAKIGFPLPNLGSPARITIKAQLQAEGVTYSNEWFTWVYPAQISSQNTQAPFYANGELLPWLEPRGAKALPQQKPYPAEAVYFSNQLTPELLDAALAGASLILYKPQGVFPSAKTRFKTAWWLGSEGDNNAGTVVYDHPVTQAMAPEGWCDNSWYRLLESSEGYLCDALPAQPESLVRGIEVACVCRNKSMLFQTSIGKGSLIVCGLNIDSTLENGGPAPEAEWLTAKLIDYAATFPHPNAAFPEDFLRKHAVEALQFNPPFVEGFAHLTSNQGETSKWFTYRKERDRAEVLRQTEVNKAIEWKTAPLPESIPEESVTLVFAGGVGWISQPATSGFELSINGKEALRFDVCIGRGIWRDGTGRVTLSFEPKRMTSEDAAGLFYLGVPRDLVKPGKPCRLTVTSLGAGSQRWFALHPYADVLSHGKTSEKP